MISSDRMVEGSTHMQDHGSLFRDLLVPLTRKTEMLRAQVCCKTDDASIRIILKPAGRHRLSDTSGCVNIILGSA